MISDKLIWTALEQSEKNARSSRIKRFLRKPIQYPMLLAYSQFVYPKLKKEIQKTTKTFFGVCMKTNLPSGTDIVLNGIKSHDSEIRLSKFLSLTLKPGDCFIDVGAHYGYYSLLASALVGDHGKVYSIEPTAASFKLLKENAEKRNNISIHQAAAGDTDKQLVLFEYPGPYAEYNTVLENAYVNEKWARKIKPVITQVDTIILDSFINEQNIHHAIIKIDVEGSEKAVLNGMKNLLQSKCPMIVMEYLLKENHEAPHKQAESFLNSVGYESYAIGTDGALKNVEDIVVYMKAQNLDSDNIVFMKKS